MIFRRSSEEAGDVAVLNGNPHVEYANLMTRLATITSVLRTRYADAVRQEANGGDAAEHAARVRQAVARLERVVVELEKAV